MNLNKQIDEILFIVAKTGVSTSYHREQIKKIILYKIELLKHTHHKDGYDYFIAFNVRQVLKGNDGNNTNKKAD